MGVILNRPSPVSVHDAVPPLAELVDGEELVHVGGPVQPQAIVVLGDFSEPDEAAALVLGSIGFLPAEIESADDVRSLSRARVFAGYAGWAAGQLESEIEEESWIIEPALPEDVFTRGARAALEHRAAPQGRAVRRARADAARPEPELDDGPVARSTAGSVGRMTTGSVAGRLARRLDAQGHPLRLGRRGRLVPDADHGRGVPLDRRRADRAAAGRVRLVARDDLGRRRDQPGPLRPRRPVRRRALRPLRHPQGDRDRARDDRGQLDADDADRTRPGSSTCSGASATASRPARSASRSRR